MDVNGVPVTFVLFYLWTCSDKNPIFLSAIYKKCVLEMWWINHYSCLLTDAWTRNMLDSDITGETTIGVPHKTINEIARIQVLTRYSNTSVRDFSVWIMSCRVTILAWRRSRRRLTSRMAVHGAPSSCSSRISFKATKFSVRRLRPL